MASANNAVLEKFTGEMLRGITSDYAGALSKPARGRESASKARDPNQIMIGFKLLCGHFGISAESQDVAVILAYCLMVKHVPFFADRSEARRGPKGMDLSETSVFFVKACEVGARLRSELGRAPSKVEISVELLPALKRLKLFEKRGKFGLQTVRKLLAQIDTATRDYNRGTANEFQRMLIDDVGVVLRR